MLQANLGGKSAMEGVHELTEGEGEVLVEKEADIFARSDVRPATVN